MALPAPKSAANTVSRATASTRLVMVAAPIRPADLARRLLIYALRSVVPLLHSPPRCALAPPLRGGSLRPSLAAAGASERWSFPVRVPPANNGSREGTCCARCQAPAAASEGRREPPRSGGPSAQRAWGSQGDPRERSNKRPPPFGGGPMEDG